MTNTGTDTRDAALEILRTLVGAPDAEFHEGQFEAIEALVADRQRALVVQRTGWGKSAVYFVATLLLRRQGAGMGAGHGPGGQHALGRGQRAGADDERLPAAPHHVGPRLAGSRGLLGEFDDQRLFGHRHVAFHAAAFVGGIGVRQHAAGRLPDAALDVRRVDQHQLQQHLQQVALPMLFLQGTRDELADLGLLRPVIERLGERATLDLFDEADHAFHVPARTGRRDADVRNDMLDAMVRWIDRILAKR